MRCPDTTSVIQMLAAEYRDNPLKPPEDAIRQGRDVEHMFSPRKSLNVHPIFAAWPSAGLAALKRRSEQLDNSKLVV